MLLISCPNSLNKKGILTRRRERYFSRRFLNYDFYVVIMLPWFLHIYVQLILDIDEYFIFLIHCTKSKSDLFSYISADMFKTSF